MKSDEKARKVTSWEAELSARPWSEATRQVRKERRPRGWKTTPQGLLERARLGEPLAVESLCKAYRDSVRSYLLRRPNTDQDLAEDATQELFIGLLRRDEKRNDLARLKLGPEDSFGAWLAGGAKNARSNALKRERRHQPLATESDAEQRDTEHHDADLRRAENRAQQLFELGAQEEARYHNFAPDRLMDLARAIELVEQAFAQLEPEYDRRLFDHLKTTLLEETVKPERPDPSGPPDLKLCRTLGFSRSNVAQNRSAMRWHRLPAAMQLLQEARRARSPNTPALGKPATSLREELRELASAFGP